MSADGDKDAALPSLPSELNDKLFALLFGDPMLRERAFAELLAGHGDHAEALRAHWQHHLRMEGAAEAPSGVGDAGSIPGYRLLAVLGEGGFGTVYLAEQKEPVRRRVALKVIKLGMDSKAVVARFALERQALAVMNHDAIAKVYDCGITERGQSYFAMELVEGEPLTGYCDKHKLSLRQRIDIFQQVCAGIQHAHQKGVLHRDLKPGNVLVAKKGDKHVAKIIDFGVARATNHQLVDQTIFTERGIMVGTPEYMSPEQACGESMHIDTRTDVYSLGVMLYELLVGELPFSSAELRAAGLLEIQRKLREDEPPKPSTKLTTRRELATEWAQKRNITVEGLRRALRGDLDWVVLKAMAKEPERRYESAMALAEDLQRYLGHEPLRAGPPSGWYRLKKLVRRHRGRVVAGSAVFLTAVVGAVVALQFALRERAKVREFNLLSGVVIYDQAVATEKDLCPPWPDRIAAMERWLREDSGQLMAMKTETEGTVQDLRQQALPATEDELKRDRESHSRFVEWQRLGQQLTSLRRAQQIRRGESKFEEPEVPADLLRFDVKLLTMYALARVAPTIKERTVWGEEAMGLACARAAAAKAAGTQDLAACLHTLAWALLANGQDDEAKHQIAAAVDVVPAERKQDFAESYQREIWDAIEQASTNLTRLESEHEALAAAVSGRRTFRLESKAQQFLHDMLVTQLQKLESLQAHEMVRVEQQLQWAKWLRDGLSRQHPKANTTWEAASAAIATADDVVASRLYAGKNIDLGEQHVMGLVPIGMNPKTKLWEFYDLRSAWDGKADPEDIAIPVHDAEGRIAVGADSGIVLVLLPGGTFTMGAQNEDPDGPNYDPAADAGLASDSVPTLEVTLAPFFLARHELTQGQWTRLWAWEESLRTPSQMLAGEVSAGRKITLANPVEQVDWDMCDRLLRWHGLVLPTEAQWEYGCRAGTTTPWSCSFEVLKDYANVADATLQQVMPRRMLGAEPWNDGYSTHAPVGSFAANEFGLFDMHGNVREWCLDLWGGLGRMRRGDGLNLKHDGSGDRAIRGGSCLVSTAYVRSGMRYANPTPRRASDLGVRAARTLRP